MITHLRTILAIVVTLCLAMDTSAENWPHWRGPHFNGSTTESNLPSHWSQSENVAWSVDLPGASAATPIIWNDHVFVSSSDVENDQLLALCFDRQTGKLLWQHAVAKGIRRDSRSNFAAPSPATDGEVVVFFYSSGELVAYNFAGEEIWKRNIQDDYGTFAFLWTFSSSPLLYDGKLYLQVLQRDVAVSGRGFSDRKNESYLLAMDPKTGKTLWRQVRPSEAQAESRESFTSPVPFLANGRPELLVVGGDDLTGHDPNTGAELWRWGTWNPERIGHWRLVTSPVASENVILVCAPKRDPIYAVKSGGKGQLGGDALAWVSNEQRDLSSDVPTPAFYDGDFFILSDVRKRLSRVEPQTGAVKWSLRTPGDAKYEASPLVGDGKVYLINFVAEVAVVDAHDGKLIEVIKMDEPSDDAVRSSISASHGQLFIRTTRKLFCIGT
jgi:outer membrane protein assembly factor BamB